jgi:effector-binding domain-containing protein
MEVRTVEERTTVSIRMTTTGDMLPQALGEGYGEIMEYLARTGIEPTGPPYSLYHNMDMESLDVEMGFPVAGSPTPEGRIRPSTIPAGRAAVAIHVGPYETMDDTYRALMAYVEREGLATEPFMYEVYLNDPDEVEPQQLQTEVYFPLRE